MKPIAMGMSHFIEWCIDNYDIHPYYVEESIYNLLEKIYHYTENR